MFAPTRYLDWARRFYGQVRFDLASSGMPTTPLAELGIVTAERFDDSSNLSHLREAIARYNAVPREETIATLGTSQALWLAYASLTSPGDEILVEEPAYEPLVRIAEGVGARVLRFERVARDGFAVDPERIARALTARTRLVVVTNLHNPSGVRVSDEALRAAATAAATCGAYLLVDEVYAPFDVLVDGGGVFRTSARKLAANVIATSSLTKCYGLGSERIGWLLAASDVVARAEDAMTACCGALPLTHAYVACQAFAHIGMLADRARGILSGKRSRVGAWIESLPQLGLTWSEPADGLFGLVTVQRAGDITPFIESVASEREVLVAAGKFFGVPNAFRIAWSAPIDVLDEGLARLGAALATCPRGETDGSSN
jgi:aspartate/methionine/tyrosine aminotransferase